jgi:hypothetical protein
MVFGLLGFRAIKFGLQMTPWCSSGTEQQNGASKGNGDNARGDTYVRARRSVVSVGTKNLPFFCVGKLIH